MCAMDTALLMRKVLWWNSNFIGLMLFNPLLYLNKLPYLKWNGKLKFSYVSFSFKNTIL